MQANSSASKRLFIGTSLVLLFLIPALGACGAVSSGTHAVGTPGAPVRTLSTQSVSPRASSGVQPCPGDTGDPAHWMHIIGTNTDNEHVESVSCANIMGTLSLQALVTDRRSDAGKTLDVYVFNNINAVSPAQIFHTFGLVKGQAKISGYNTILTAQVGELSALNTSKPVSAMTADLFREFKWSASANTLALLSWPGAGSNDASLGLLLLAVFLFVGGSLLILVSLFCLKVHWLLVIGVLLVSLLAPYVQGRLFPTGPASWGPNWFLTFGVVVLVLSLILLGRVRGIWATLWRTLLVTGVSAAIVYAVAYVCAQVAAAGSGPINGQPPPGSPVYPLVSLLVGSVDILIIVYWLTRKGIEPSLSD